MAGSHRRSVGIGALIGAGVTAAIDEIVFHQILAWHHFYDRATPTVALLSDGLLHAAEVVILVAGIFLVADLRRRDALVPRAVWGGFFLGAGAFQLFDGVVDHKLLRVHQIRYGVQLLPYDLAWNACAAVLIAIGALVIWSAGRAPAGAAASVAGRPG